MIFGSNVLYVSPNHGADGIYSDNSYQVQELHFYLPMTSDLYLAIELSNSLRRLLLECQRNITIIM